MATCRKCGNNSPTRRGAGEYFCQHCGFLPGPKQMDRCGNERTLAKETESTDE